MNFVYTTILLLGLTGCGGSGGATSQLASDPSGGGSTPTNGGGGGSQMPQYTSGEQFTQNFYALPINFSELQFEAAAYQTAFCTTINTNIVCWDNGPDPTNGTSSSFWDYTNGHDPALFIATLWSTGTLRNTAGYTDVDVMTQGALNTATCTVQSDLVTARCRITLNDPQAFTISLE